MNKDNVETIITQSFNEKEVLKEIDADRDFFEVGISSLTVVELQIIVEKQLKVEVSTSDLMLNPTLNGWIDLYQKKIKKSGAKVVEEAIS